MNDVSTDPKLTFRRFEEGETPADWDLEEKIFVADTSYKCPTYVHKTPPCQGGACPSGGMKFAAGWLLRAAWTSRRSRAWPGRNMRFSGWRRPIRFRPPWGAGLPGTLRSGLQPQRGG